MRLPFVHERMLRIRTLRGWTSTTVDGSGSHLYGNAGDVVEAPVAVAQGLIDGGVCELTEDEPHRAPVTYRLVPCACGILNSEHAARCENRLCGRRLQ